MSHAEFQLVFPHLQGGALCTFHGKAALSLGGGPTPAPAGGANSLLAHNTTNPVPPVPALGGLSQLTSSNSLLHAPSEVGARLASFVSGDEGWL